jgi:hypothetical protein
MIQTNENKLARHSAKMLAKWGIRHQPRPKVFFSPPKTWEEIKKIRVANSGINRGKPKNTKLREQIEALLKAFRI